MAWYRRFGLMIITSTVVMFALMYLNTFAGEHVFFSEMRAYMAVLMGVVMAVVMHAYRWGMYPKKGLNIAILVVQDARVSKLADEIIDTQRREIAKMQLLIADVCSEREAAKTVYEDPPSAPGSVADALPNTLISQPDLAPLTPDEADQILQEPTEGKFKCSQESALILWAGRNGTAAIKLNEGLVALQGAGELRHDTVTFASPGTTVTVCSLGDGSFLKGGAAARKK